VREDGEDDYTGGLLEWLYENGVNIGTTRSEWDGWSKEVQVDLSNLQRTSSSQPHADMPTFKPDISREDYIEGIEKCRDAIHSGNSYELTLTTTFRAPGPSKTTDSFDLYRRLRSRNPAPYSVYLHLPTVGTTILSSSPERFVRIDGRGGVEMKPIKGTRARVRCSCERGKCEGPGGDECEQWCRAKDEEEGRKLEEDKKERAENLMVSWVSFLSSHLRLRSPKTHP
jgi:para-aminobenzoate synthetase